MSPFESRWEAIEEAERAYRDTKTRVATDQIGLAKLREGLDLIRIGQPMLPEFASWRYGDVFKSRWRRHMIGEVAPIVGGLVGLTLLFTPYRNMAFLGIGPTGLQLGSQAISIYKVRRWHRVPRYAVRDDNGGLLRMSGGNAAGSFIRRNPEGSWYLRLEHRVAKPAGALLGAFGKRVRLDHQVGYTSVTGDAAERALKVLLPVLNRVGGDRKQVEGAVQLVTSEKDIIAKFFGDRDRHGRPTVPRDRGIQHGDGALNLAMEMSLHEADERRALEGELDELAARWKDAEEIAAIADGLLLPDAINERVDRMRSD